VHRIDQFPVFPVFPAVVFCMRERPIDGLRCVPRAQPVPSRALPGVFSALIVGFEAYLTAGFAI
jgi:hypothetical protein